MFLIIQRPAIFLKSLACTRRRRAPVESRSSTCSNANKRVHPKPGSHCRARRRIARSKRILNHNLLPQTRSRPMFMPPLPKERQDSSRSMSNHYLSFVKPGRRVVRIGLRRQSPRVPAGWQPLTPLPFKTVIQGINCRNRLETNQLQPQGNNAFRQLVEIGSHQVALQQGLARKVARTAASIEISTRIFIKACMPNAAARKQTPHKPKSGLFIPRSPVCLQQPAPRLDNLPFCCGLAHRGRGHHAPACAAMPHQQRVARQQPEPWAAITFAKLQFPLSSSNSAARTVRVKDLSRYFRKQCLVSQFSVASLRERGLPCALGKQVSGSVIPPTAARVERSDRRAQPREG